MPPRRTPETERELHMNLIDMFYREIEDAKARKVPLIIPIGTMEYHGEHASLGTDTMVITGVLERLGKRKEIIVAPPIWYGVASYAVCGPEKNSVQVDCDPYEIYITEILKSLVYGGWKNIYLVFHHQSEGDGLMPMSLACMKAAKKVTMRYMEETRGNGWWGRNDMQDYYENLDTADNPLTFIKTIQLMDAATQKAIGGFDHAGKYETSLLSAVFPQNVDFERTHWNTEWFAIPSQEASIELGEMMVAKTLDYLDFMFKAYDNEEKRHLTICIGCTGGQHRSVTLANYLFDHYKDKYMCYLAHRELK